MTQAHHNHISCPYCNGEGKGYDMLTQKYSHCPHCKGLGEVEVIDTPKAQAVERLQSEGYSIVQWTDVVWMYKGNRHIEVHDDGTVTQR